MGLSGSDTAASQSLRDGHEAISLEPLRHQDSKITPAHASNWTRGWKYDGRMRWAELMYLLATSCLAHNTRCAKAGFPSALNSPSFPAVLCPSDLHLSTSTTPDTRHSSVIPRASLPLSAPPPRWSVPHTLHKSGRLIHSQGASQCRLGHFRSRHQHIQHET
jgi:hypothetical protein